MSTQTQTSQSKGFKGANVQRLPRLVSKGRVVEFGPVKLTESQNYYNIRIKLEGEGGSRGTSHNFLFRPEEFTPDFDPETLRNQQDEDGDTKVGDTAYRFYRQTIYSSAKGSVSILQGLCGSDEVFEAFDTFRREAYANVVANGRNEFTPEEIRSLLVDFLTQENLKDQTVGYVLKQRQDKIGEDDNGKGQYVPAEGYELDRYYYYTDENVASFVKQAKKDTKNTIKMGFEVD